MEEVRTNAAPGAEGGVESHNLSMEEIKHTSNGLGDRIETSALRSSPHPVEGRDESFARTPMHPKLEALSGQSHGDQAANSHAIKKEESDETYGISSNGVQSFVGEGNSLVNGISDTLGQNGNTYGVIYHPDRLGPSLPLPPDSHQIDDISFLDSAASMVESEAPRIQAFAKLEFEDGQFYMNTYAVELGRDIRAAKRALEKDLVAGQDQDRSGIGGHPSESSADIVHTSRKLKREESIKAASSVVSESGGIMNLDMQDTEPRKRSRSKRTKSETSSSRNLSRKNSFMQIDYQSLAEASLKKSKYDVHPVDALSLMPSPDECPLIPIHPPQLSGKKALGHRGISRRHARIAYNFDKRLFEVEAKGRNGIFVDEHFYEEGRTAELKSGSYIQISGISVRFILPDIAIGETGAEPTIESEAHSAMSFDFEDGRGESIAMADSDSESSDSQRDTRSEEPESDGNVILQEDEDSSDDVVEPEERIEEDMDDGENTDEEDEEAPVTVKKAQTSKRKRKPAARPRDQPEQPKTKLKLKFKLKQKPPPKVKPPMKAKEQPEEVTKPELLAPLIDLGIPASMIPPRRKGPGRPPKNGIMSKREIALISKQRKDEEKAKAIADGTLQPDKRKELGDVQQEKRKYTKRKRPDGQPDDPTDVLETTEGNDTLTSAETTKPMPKPPKEKRPPKPPRSPSPVFDEATLTPEQLAKPQQSYVVLIHEALSNSKTGQMSLPQIYRAIERKYPWYKLRVTTQGWQSSVRHNLSQHAAFRRIERDGKGWMWGLVPEVSIEKERKRRPSPPPMQTPNYYPPGPHIYRPPYPYPSMPPPPNGQMPPPPGHNPYLYALPPGQGYPPPGVLPRGVNNLPISLAAPQNNATSTYQSPYTPAPQTQAQPQNQIQPPDPSLETNQPQSQQNTENHLGVAHQAPNQQMSTSITHTQAPQLLALIGTQQANPHSSQISSTSSYLPLSDYFHDAIKKFKSALITSLSPATHNAEEVITRAIDRTLGIAPPASETHHEEHPAEQHIKDALTGMLEQLKENDRRATSSVPPRPSASPAPGPLQQNISPTLQRTAQPLQLPQQAPETLPLPNGSTEVNLLDVSHAASTSPSVKPPSPSNDPRAPSTSSSPVATTNPTSPPPSLPTPQRTPLQILLQTLGHKVSTPAPLPAPPSTRSSPPIPSTTTDIDPVVASIGADDAHTISTSLEQDKAAQVLAKSVEGIEKVVDGDGGGVGVSEAEVRGTKRKIEEEEKEKGKKEDEQGGEKRIKEEREEGGKSVVAA